MINKIKSIQNSKKLLREFGFVFGFGFVFMIGLAIPFITGHPFRTWTLYISFPIILIGIFSPMKLNILYKFWLFLGDILGWINSRLILFLIFILVLLPMALFMKLFSYDPLNINKKISSSYKEDRKNLNVNLTKMF